ncbi:hypothetical protein KAU33_10230 [Candidatus Dependentiae bacterium]|nr:hypothetical protein [Candidatus Dependentiae bacterium]
MSTQRIKKFISISLKFLFTVLIINIIMLISYLIFTGSGFEAKAIFLGLLLYYMTTNVLVLFLLNIIPILYEGDYGTIISLIIYILFDILIFLLVYKFSKNKLKVIIFRASKILILYKLLNILFFLIRVGFPF